MRATTCLFVLCAAACGGEDPQTPVPGDIALEITSPTAGAELLAAEHPTIVVTGTATTTSSHFDVLDLYVNGARVELGDDGAFTAEVTPVAGINHIAVEASDGINPIVSKELDVMWAPGYLAPISGTTGFDLAGALDLRLGQRFFDARLLGTTLDLAPDPVVATDLGSALELILWHVDLAGLLAGGIQIGSGSSQLNVTIASAAPAQIVVDAKVIHSPTKAVDLKIDLLGVFLEMDGTFQFNNRTLVIDGGIGADMHASARLTLAVAADGTIDVDVVNVTATVGPLNPSFTGADGDELNAFITIGNNDFRLLIENMIAQELIPTFTNRVPPLLETLLGAANNVLDNVSFTLDTGLGGTPVTLELDGKVGALDVMAGPAISTAPGHVTVVQDLAIRTSGAPIHATSRGAPRIDAEPARPAALTAGVQLAMRQDFLNALLHSLWNAGLLEGTAMFGGITAGVSAKLPPFVRPITPATTCTIDGERCDVILELGQIEIALTDFEQSFAVNAAAGARIKVDGATVSLVIQPTPTLTVWETSAESGILTPEAVRDLIANVVWPELFGAIGDNLSITLPLPDLASLGLDQIAPTLTNARLELLMRQRPTISGGYLTLGADLELEAPQPP